MRKCTECKSEYTPKYNSTEKVCSFKCAITHGRKLQKKDQKAKDKEFKTKVRANDRSWHVKTLQTVFNKFIRLRDHGGLCISCQTIPKKKNAGHYKSTGASPELRFSELNVNLQCEHCNSFKSGAVDKYRPNLVNKIGLANVEWLEGPHEPKKYTIQELQDMIKDYRAKVKTLENNLTSVIK